MLGYKTHPKQILEELVPSFKRLLEANPYDVLALWRNKLNLDNKLIKVKGLGNHLYKFLDLQPDGRLLLASVKYGRKMTIDNGDSIRYDFD